jgi:hypothetical protein
MGEKAGQYIQQTIGDLVVGWLAEAKAEGDLDASVTFYSHLALIHEFTDNLRDFLFW